MPKNKDAKLGCIFASLYPLFFSFMAWIILLVQESELRNTERLTLIAIAAMGPILILILSYDSISGAVYKFIGWFKTKEIEEINLIESKIAAVENGLTYEQDIEDQFSTFYYLALFQRTKPKSNHSLTFSTGTTDVRIFDQVYLGSNSYFIGTWVNLKRTKLPNFDILNSDVRSRVYPFDTMEQIDIYPDLYWLDGSLKLVKPSTQSTVDIESLLLQSRPLVPILGREDFHLLTMRGANLCLYTTGKLMTSSEQIVELKEMAIELVNIFTSSTSLFDIERLKQNERDQDSYE